jgi:hypothetical protein
MKLLFKNYLAIIFLLLTLNITAQINCGTNSSRNEINLDSLFSIPKSTQAVNIPIKIHIVRNSSGGLGATYSNIQSQIALTNQHFTGSNLQFSECGPVEYINSSTLYSFSQSSDESSIVNYNVTNVVNIYYVNTVMTNEGINVGGYAYYPWSANPSQHYIIIALGNYNDNNTLSHELGHFFGLYHTHEQEAYGIEYVNGSNCASTGDLICDTQADPNCAGCLSGCSYAPNGGNCPYTDPIGGTYNPPVTNIMSYTLSCGQNFTSQQKNRLNQYYQAYRTYLTCSVSSNGDNCSAPLPISSNTSCVYTPGTLTGLTSNSPSISIQTCSGYLSPQAQDIWYSFTAQSTTHTILVDPQGTYSGTSDNNYMDPVIGLYSSCSSNGFIQCEDDPGGGGGNCDMIVNGLTIGTTYYIRVYDYNVSTNAPTNPGFNICVTHVDITPPDEHDFYIDNLVLNNTTYAEGDALTIDVDQYTTTPDGSSETVYLEYTVRDMNGNLISTLGTDNSPIGGGDAYDPESISTTFPAGVTGNSCQICAEANYDLSVTETNTSNNRTCITVAVTGNPPTEYDLYTTNLVLNSTSYAEGDALDISIDAYTDSPGGLYVDPFVEYTLRTPNGVLIQQLGTDWASLGEGDAYDTETISITFPSSITAGQYLICAEVNYNGTFPETNTNNNRTCTTITVIGNPANYNVITSSSPTNGGTTIGDGQYTSGDQVIVTASANTNWQFTNWTENGIIVSTNPSYSFIINADITLVANFTSVSQPTTFNIQASANPSNAGTIYGTGTYQSNTTVSLINVPNQYWQFLNWTENNVIVSANSNYQFTANADRVLVANYIPLTAIDENMNENEYKLYPNPTNNLFTIEFKNNKRRNISVINQTGQTILQINSNNKITPINLTDWPIAMYIVHIIDEDGNTISKKIIKQ